MYRITSKIAAWGCFISENFTLRLLWGADLGGLFISEIFFNTKKFI